MVRFQRCNAPTSAGNAGPVTAFIQAAANLLFVLALLACMGPAQTQSVGYLDCVVPGNSACHSWLSGQTWTGYAQIPSVVIVAGFNAPNDSGGGEFMQSTTALCQNPATNPSGTTAAGSEEITSVTPLTDLAPGYSISAPGYIPAGAEISSVVPPHTIYITQNAIQTGSGVTLSVNGDNGGTQEIRGRLINSRTLSRAVLATNRDG
jgi:hypothetical protein